MSYAPTIAEGWETIRTDRPLVDIVNDHATSRVLSETTRQTFRYIGDNVPVDPSEREAAFFEAAASMSTRKGQSYARRVALGDLARLRQAVVDGKPITRDHYYTVGLPVTLKVEPNGRVTAYVDISEAADLNGDEALNDAVRQHDAELVGLAVDNRTLTLEIA